MAINFPTTLDTLINPTATDQVAVVSHASQHSNTNDILEALETKVGIDGSAVTTSHDYKLGEVLSTDKAVGKIATQILTNKTLTSPVITNASSSGTDSGTETLTNKTLTTPTISSTGFTNAQHAHTGASSGGQLAEGSLLLTDITTNNATSSRHGFLPKLSNVSSEVLLGTGVFGTPTGIGKYGGTGADGALSISSGTTTINVGGAALYILNYTSISITGTGSLAFSNPNANGTVIIIKSQGNVTLTSSGTAINVSGMGAAGSTDGGTWSLIKTYKGANAAAGGGGGGSITAGTTSGGAGGVAATLVLPASPLSIHLCKYPNAFVGAGGGTGTSGAAAAGIGGGALILECAGSFNFTTGTISAAGTSGAFSSPFYGGNGGGGSIFISYNTLTANSGTTLVTGPGSGAAGGVGTAYIISNTEIS
jgi:hypothetical protein